MKPELKPCPFCGGDASFDHDDNGWNWIHCKSCDATTDARVSAMDDCRPLLAEAWNRRVPAKTAKVPSDDDIRAMWNASCASDFGNLTSDLVRHFARALLAKYSEQTRECSEHHAKCSEVVGYAAEDMADQGAQAFRDGLNAALKAAQDARDSLPLPQYHGASRCVAVIKELIESAKK